jgi:alkylated DNA repair dioxygenase AlkB
MPSKRTIQDYFPVSRKRIRVAPATDYVRADELQIRSPPTRGDGEEILTTAVQCSSEVKTTAVPGLELHEEFITPAEENAILAFLTDPSRCTWRTDLSRRTMHFGGTYCLFTQPNKPSNATVDPSLNSSEAKTRPAIIQAPPMPVELSWLLDRFTEKGIFLPSQQPQYLIVNEYHTNLGISAHVENFSFSEPVVGLSLLSPVSMRFLELEKPNGGSVRSGGAARARKTGRLEDVELLGRGLCVMRASSRWSWQHEIRRSAKGRGVGWRRVSLTFRHKPGG